jgi:nicotinamide phosphoribosyltransferase
MNKNLLLCTDIYKVGHMLQYKPGTTKVYSYLTTRSDKKIPYTIFFGLQYYLKEYLSRPITKEDADEFCEYYKMILGVEPNEETKVKVYGLVELGYLPLKIKAVPEGTIMPVKNVLLTMTNTHPQFAWVVGFFESLILKLWNTTTVASYSHKLRQLCVEYADATCDNNDHVNFQVHDFGYRGVSSEETAALSGAAHLLNFLGTDTVPAVAFHKEYYAGEFPIGLSVPASEHSVMCSFGRDNELDAFRNMLSLYPSGIVSIVSDTYNIWNVLTNFASQLKDEILARDGKVVFRPDSGDPEQIINGSNECNCKNDICGPMCEPDCKGALQLLWEQFGGTINSKGYKVLNPKVGLIYGDGMYYDRFKRILKTMEENGFASSNLVIGVGGLLLQDHSRDDQAYAIKATYSEVNGVPFELMKDPITDSKKKSHKGLLALFQSEYDGSYLTYDQCTPEMEEMGLLKTVFEDGKILVNTNLQEIRKRVLEG